MALSSVSPSPRNIDGAYTSSMRMGLATKFAPASNAQPGVSRQFAEYMRPSAPQPAPGVMPISQIQTRIGSEI